MYAYELELIDIQILNVILLIVALSSIIAVILEKKAHIFFKGSTKKSISFSEPKPKVGEV